MHDWTGDGSRDVARPVRKESDDGSPLPDPPDFSIEPLQLEPVCGRAGGDQIDRAGRQRDAIGRLVPVLDALVRLGTRQLIAARVGGHHAVDVLGQRDRHLTVPRAGIPGQRATGDHRGQPGEERIGVARPMPRIRVRVTGVVIFERHGPVLNTGTSNCAE